MGPMGPTQIIELFGELLEEVAKYARDNTAAFLLTVLLITAPLFALSAYLSLKLAKRIEVQKKKLKAIEKMKSATKKEK